MIDFGKLAEDYGLNPVRPLPVTTILVVTGISVLSDRTEPLARYPVGGQKLSQLQDEVRDNNGYRIEFPAPSKNPGLKLDFSGRIDG